MSKRALLFSLIFLAASALGAQSAPSTTLLITEVFYDTPGADEEREWVEIANVGTAVLDLSDVKLGDEETAGGSEGMVRFPSGAVIEPGQAVVVAQTAAGFQALYGRYPDFEISDTRDEVPDMRRFSIWADGDLALANDGDELLLLQGLAIIDALGYGDSQAIFNPAIGGVLTGQSIERLPADCDSNTAADWQTQTTPAPGRITPTGECTAPVNPAELEDLPPIGAIQGDGRVSPFVNERVSFRGVATGVFEDRNASGITFYTLFVQDLPGHEDGDPATADGMAVFLGRERPSYRPGDQLRITGLVTEFFDYTEIDDDGLEILVESRDTPLPEPINIRPPRGLAAQNAYFEPLESMLVTIDGLARVVGPTYSGCGFAVVRADSGLARVFRRSAGDLAGPIVTILHNSDVRCDGFPDVKIGDEVSGITGPLIYNFNAFKIVQGAAENLAVTAVPPTSIPPPPSAAPGQFSIATFNVENHFDSIDDTGDDAEPKPSGDEIAAKQTKLAYAISHTLGCPTLVAVQEVEKESLLLDLAAETAAACGFTYAVTHRESADARGIDLALLSNPRRVMVTAVALRQTCTPLNTGINDPTIDCAAGQQPLFSRPPLQVDVLIDDLAYTIIVNHFKSKRGGEEKTAPRRLAQASHIAALVEELQAQNREARVIVLGDFNDYEQSPPLNRMAEAGHLTNILGRVPDKTRYSFIFGGVSQLIDGILLSENLIDVVTAVTIQHANADYPDSLGRDLSPANLAYKSTDHDLPLVVLAVADNTSPTPPASDPPSEPAATATPVPEEAEPDVSASRGWWLAGGLLAGLVALLALLSRRRK